MLLHVRSCCNWSFGLLFVPHTGWVDFCSQLPRRNSYNKVICPVFHSFNRLRQCLTFYFLCDNWRMIFMMYTVSNLPKVSLALDRWIYEAAIRVEEPHGMEDQLRARVKIDNYFTNCPKPCLAPPKIVFPEVLSLCKTYPNDEFRLSSWSTRMTEQLTRMWWSVLIVNVPEIKILCTL